MKTSDGIPISNLPPGVTDKDTEPKQNFGHCGDCGKDLKSEDESITGLCPKCEDKWDEED